VRPDRLTSRSRVNCVCGREVVIICTAGCTIHGQHSPARILCHGALVLADDRKPDAEAIGRAFTGQHAGGRG